MEYTERAILSQDWITLLLVGCLVLLALARQLFPRRFEEFILLPVTNKYFLVQGKDNEITHPFNLMLFGVQIISISLFIYLVFQQLRPEITQTQPWLFVQISTGYAVLVGAKYCVEKIIGVVFSMESLLNSYLYQKLSYRNVIGLLFLVLNTIFFFIFTPTPSLLLGCVAVVVVVNCIALFSSYKSNRNLLIRHFFYFILYLCALEISPYLILYKVLI